MKLRVILLTVSVCSVPAIGAAQPSGATPDPDYCARRDADPEKCVIKDGPPPRPIVRKPQKPPVLPPEPPAPEKPIQRQQGRS
jgi:hypothetical protein